MEQFEQDKQYKPETATDGKTEQAEKGSKEENRLNITFHNPNTPEETARFLAKVMVNYIKGIENE